MKTSLNEKGEAHTHATSHEGKEKKMQEQGIHGGRREEEEGVTAGDQGGNKL